MLQIGKRSPQRQAVVWEGEAEYHQRENEREGEAFLSPGQPVSPLSPPLQSSSAKPAVKNMSAFPSTVPEASVENKAGFRLIPSAEVGKRGAGGEVEYDKAGYVVRKRKRYCGSWSLKKRENGRGSGAWRRGKWGWLGWAIFLTVWGIVCFVIGGAVGINMR